ncbi:hypothetical protein ACIRRA_38505 [Nocardia sp. NPDC101769]|uniref:hypothetical protein n=1 Tax=Nocardia sp. NPDC101769 TaxID=3364333 RepID=UPI003813DEE3
MRWAYSGDRPTSGILNSTRELGGSLGLAILATVAANTTGSATDPTALAHGYTTALRLAAALLATGSIIATLIVPHTAAPSTSHTIHPDTQPAPPMLVRLTKLES